MPILRALTTLRARFAPCESSIAHDLAVAAKVDKLLIPLEKDIVQATVVILHRVLRRIRRITRHANCNHQKGCGHFQRFTQLVRSRAQYIVSRGWHMARREDSINELIELKKLLPEREHELIDHEIEILEQTRSIIVRGSNKKLDLEGLAGG